MLTLLHVLSWILHDSAARLLQHQAHVDRWSLTLWSFESHFLHLFNSCRYSHSTSPSASRWPTHVRRLSSPSAASSSWLRRGGRRRRAVQRPLRRRRPTVGTQELRRERFAQSATRSGLFSSLTLILTNFSLPVFQWWPSTTTPRTRTTSCLSWRGRSFTSSRRTMTAGSRASATASPDCSPATTWSPSCTTPTEGTSQ